MRIKESEIYNTAMTVCRLYHKGCVEWEYLYLIFKNKDGLWELPGGKQESCDEYIEQTAIREFYEEMGIELPQDFIDKSSYEYLVYNEELEKYAKVTQFLYDFEYDFTYQNTKIKTKFLWVDAYSMRLMEKNGEMRFKVSDLIKTHEWRNENVG